MPETYAESSWPGLLIVLTRSRATEFIPHWSYAAMRFMIRVVPAGAVSSSTYHPAPRRRIWSTTSTTAEVTGPTSDSGDEQVRAIIEGRGRSRADVVAELWCMADDDPIMGDERRLGHLYLLAQPEIASDEMFLDLLTRNDAMQDLQEIIQQISRHRGSGTTRFQPDTNTLQHRIPRAEGMAITSYSPEDGPGREQSLLELVIREDGGIRLICGREPTPFRGEDHCLWTDHPWPSSPCSCWA